LVRFASRQNEQEINLLVLLDQAKRKVEISIKKLLNTLHSLPHQNNKAI
jgi:hypothetical protein